MDSHYWPLATHCGRTLPSPPRTGSDTSFLSLSKVEVLGRNIPLVRPGHVLISQLPGTQSRCHPFSFVGESWLLPPQALCRTEFLWHKRDILLQSTKVPLNFPQSLLPPGLYIHSPPFPLPLLQANPPHSFFFFFWLHQVLVVSHRIFRCGMQTLSCSMWDLVP